MNPCGERRTVERRGAARGWLMACALGLLSVMTVRYLYYDVLVYEQFVRMVSEY
jgi:hypothetical protein